MLDHPTGGVGIGCQGLLVALLGQQGGLQLGEVLGAGVVVIGFQLFGEQADSGGELLGLDAQLPEGAGSARRTLRCDALQRAGGTGGIWSGSHSGRGDLGGDGDGDGDESGHGSAWGMDRRAPMGAGGLRSRWIGKVHRSVRRQRARPRDRRMG